jgi:hypothetical protein
MVVMASATAAGLIIPTDPNEGAKLQSFSCQDALEQAGWLELVRSDPCAVWEGACSGKKVLVWAFGCRCGACSLTCR